MADYINTGLEIDEQGLTDVNAVHKKGIPPKNEKAKLNDIVFSQCYDFIYYSNYINKLEEKRNDLNVSLLKMRAAGMDENNVEYTILNNRERSLHTEQLSCKKLLDQLGFATLAYKIGGLESVAIIARAAATNGASVRNQNSATGSDLLPVPDFNANNEVSDENNNHVFSEVHNIKHEYNLWTDGMESSMSQNSFFTNTKNIDFIPLPGAQNINGNTNIILAPDIDINDQNHISNFSTNSESASHTYHTQDPPINNQANGSAYISFQATGRIDSHMACNFYPVYSMTSSYGPILAGYQIINIANFQSVAVFQNCNHGLGSNIIPNAQGTFSPFTRRGYSFNRQQSIQQCYVHVSSMTGFQFDYSSTFSQQTILEWNSPL